MLSLAIDLGADVARNATRRETATSLSQAFPVNSSSTLLLAERADEAVFAAGNPSDEEIQRFWAEVDDSLEAMTGSVGFWRRQRAKYSARSLAAEGGQTRAVWRVLSWRPPMFRRHSGAEGAGGHLD